MGVVVVSNVVEFGDLQADSESLPIASAPHAATGVGVRITAAIERELVVINACDREGAVGPGLTFDATDSDLISGLQTMRATR